MKGRLIAIEPTKAGAMAALVEDGQIVDLLVDPADEAPALEEIHLVRVKRIIPKQGAAHVKMANGGKGFLRDAKGLKEGQLVVAQVSSLASPDKGVPLTARRLHRGRYAILTPDAPGVNVARSIRDEETRARLIAIGMEANVAGMILRSASADADDDDIREDIAALVAVEQAVLDGEAAHEIALLAAAPGAEMTAWREWSIPEPDEVIQEEDVFDRLGLWDQINILLGRDAPLPGGGWMAIEPTTALVAVDVNTGGDMSPQAAAEANLAACTELPRQLLLRGLGGQVTIDFAPMRKNDRKAVESTLRRALLADPVQTTMAGWTPLGHFELIRKRERRPLSEVMSDG